MPAEDQPAPREEASAADLFPRQPATTGPETDVPLDANLIKVLASDTRLDLLRLLKQRRMTLTEMARATGLQKATVLEHLERLTSSGLVRRHDDERLWVYYELTRRGATLLNPGRARIYLLVGTGLAAALAGVALLVAFQGLVGPAPAGEEGFQVALQEHAVTAGGPFQVHALLEGGAPGVPRAWLLPEAQLEALRAGAPVDAVPLDEERDGALVELRASTALPPGTYYLYVRDASGRDNLEALPALRVEEVVARLDRSVWWRGLDGPVAVQVARGAEASQGSLVLVPARGEGSTALTALVRDGAARLGTEALDQADAGVYALRFLPADGGPALALNATFEVRAPQLAVAPLALPEGRAAQLRVTVLTEGEAREPPAVRVRGAPVAPDRVEGATLVLALPPMAPGAFDVQVGRLAPRSVAVHSDPRVTFAQLGNGTLELRLAQPGGAPAAGVAVFLDGAAAGFSDGAGELRLGALAQGEHLVALLWPDGRSAQRAVVVEGWGVREAPGGAEVEPRAAAEEPGRARVEVNVTSRAAVPEPVTVLALLDGVPAGSEPLALPARGQASAVLDLDALRPGERVLEVRVEPLARQAVRFVNETAPPPPAPAPPPATPPSSPVPGAPPSSPSSPSSPPAAATPPGPVESPVFRAVASAELLLHVPAPPPLAGLGGLTGDPATEPLRAGGLQGRAATPGPGLGVLLAAVAVALAVVRRRQA